MQWYYADNGQQSGPLDNEEFAARVNAGTITAETLVWHEGMGDWQAYGEIAPPAETPAPVESADEDAAPAEDATGDGFCSECGQPFPLADMIQYESSSICAGCKPTFFQRVQEGAELPGVLAYGGFWIRFAAKIIDMMILSAVNMIFAFIAGLGAAGAASAGGIGAALTIQFTLMFVQIAVMLGYTVFFLGRFGATPGKMACKLKVIRSDGSAITYGRAVGRYFAEMLSGLILYIGYLMAAFDDQRRTLHDRIADTRVIQAE